MSKAMNRVIMSDVFSTSQCENLKQLMRSRDFKYGYIERKKNSFSRTYRVANIGIDEIKEFKEKYFNTTIVSTRGHSLFEKSRRVVKRLNYYIHCLKHEKYMTFDEYQQGIRHASN